MRVVAANGLTYYRAQIAIDDPAALEQAHVKLQPGLPASGHVETHARSLINYLFQPIAEAAGGVFRQG